MVTLFDVVRIWDGYAIFSAPQRIWCGEKAVWEDQLEMAARWFTTFTPLTFSQLESKEKDFKSRVMQR